MLFSHPNVGPPNGLFFSFPTKILRAFISFPVCATCTASLILLDLITQNTGHESCHYTKPRYCPQTLIYTHTQSQPAIFP